MVIYMNSTDLKEAELPRSPVRGTDTLVIGVQCDAVAPCFTHVEALGMPDMRLQPYVLLLSPCILS